MKRISLLEAVKWIFFLAFCVMLLLHTLSNRPSKAAFSKVAEQVKAAADISDMKEGNNMMIRRLYKIDPAQYEGAMLYYPATNMGAGEILLIKVKDRKQTDAVLKSMEERVASQKKNFNGYGVEQTAMLEKCVLEEKGNFLILAVQSNPDAVRKAFEQAV